MRLLVQQEGRVHRVRRPGLALVRDQSSTGHTEPRTPPSERRWDTARGISGAAQPGPLLEEAQSAARGRTRRAAHTRAPACRGSAIGRERGCPIDGRRRHRNDCIPSLSGRSEAPGERQSPARSRRPTDCHIAVIRSGHLARLAANLAAAGLIAYLLELSMLSPASAWCRRLSCTRRCSLEGAAGLTRGTAFQRIMNFRIMLATGPKGGRNSPLRFHVPCWKMPFAWLRALNPSTPW